jgi:hypothetical protein
MKCLLLADHFTNGRACLAPKAGLEPDTNAHSGSKYH